MKEIIVSVSAPGVRTDVGPPKATAALGTPVVKEYVDADPWEGSYEITPGDTEQVLECANYRMTNNITVGAVPSNYGKITWNGSALTVT